MDSDAKGLAMIGALLGLAAGLAAYEGLCCSLLKESRLAQRLPMTRNKQPVTLFGPPALGLVVQLLSGSVFVAGIFLLAAFAWQPAIARMALRRRRRNIEAALAPTLEVAAMGISAGMALDETVVFVLDCGPPAVRPALQIVQDALGSGETRRDALSRLPAHAGDGFSPLVEVLLAAERDGSPVALVLDRLAAEATTAYRNSAEERARRTPVLLLGPLMVCGLPAVLIGAVAPFVIIALGQTPL